MRLSFALVLASLVVPPARSSWSDSPNRAGYHTLTTEWFGDRCLDTIGTARPGVLDCDDTGGQHWTLQPQKGGYVRLMTERDGDTKCLDILNDGKGNNQLNMTACGNASGQFWKITPAKNGYVTLTNGWRGDKLCLDILNDGKANNRPILAACANVSGQHWKIAPVERSRSDRPRTDQVATRPTPEGLDGAVARGRTFAPTFLLWYRDCALVLPAIGDFPAPTSEARHVVFACIRKNKKTATCRVKDGTFREGFEASNHVFEAAITSDTAKKLVLATPRRQLELTTDTISWKTTMTQRLPNTPPMTCSGAYGTAKEAKAFLAEVDAKARQEAEREEASQGASFGRDDEDDDEVDSGRSRPAARDSAPKGSARGRMCGKDSDCQSGSCKMENRTRGRCE